MNREIPRWAVKATVQFIPQLISLPTVVVHMNFPRDTEEMLELLEAWHDRRGGNVTRFTFNELVETDPTTKILRQVSVDLKNVLFVETHYYGETNAQPSQTSP